MHSRRRRVHSAGRPRQVKRQFNSNGQLTAPITITIVTNPTTTTSSESLIITTTSSESSTIVTSSSSEIPTSTLFTVGSSSSPGDSLTTSPPSPVASAVVTSNSSTSTSTDAPDSSALATRSLPAGAIVGLVIGGVIIVLAVGILLLRSRFVKARNQRRATWLNQGGIGNVATVGGSTFAPASNSFAAAEKYPTERPDVEVNVYRPPVPPPTSYNNPVSPRTPFAAAPVSSEEGARVKFTFIPSLPDELSISNGEVVVVLQEFDDGWALCRNGRGQEGMVPLECLALGAEVPNNGGDNGLARGDLRNSKRDSSLNMIVRRV
ncbi:hypothetical protein C8J56DRAFT_994145 [Mycena floridula]|nr:hypothetical protein C8J56DRAFT_994145 [Mycena floridula]